MANLRVFHSPEFGKLEVMMIDGKEHFPATDVARTLSYANPHKAVSNHCRYLTKREVPHPQNPDKLIERSRMHTYWTQKGRIFLYELLRREKGLVPTIERNSKSA